MKNPKEYYRQWAAKNRDKRRESLRRWRENNPDYWRQWVKKNLEKRQAATLQHRKAYPMRVKARQAINNAIKHGKVIRPTLCQRCNETGLIQAHHPDYSKPLEVLWLCYQCHLKEHLKP